jgi:hypothetical protein
MAQKMAVAEPLLGSRPDGVRAKDAKGQLPLQWAIARNAPPETTKIEEFFALYFFLCVPILKEKYRKIFPRYPAAR